MKLGLLADRNVNKQSDIQIQRQADRQNSCFISMIVLGWPSDHMAILTFYPINSLGRRDQCNIFQLRTGHINLNFHRNRIDPLFTTICRNCMYPYETVEHFLLYCDRLVELRESLLPPNSNIENWFYTNNLQLQKTSQFYQEASRVYEG